MQTQNPPQKAADASLYNVHTISKNGSWKRNVKKLFLNNGCTAVDAVAAPSNSDMDV